MIQAPLVRRVGLSTVSSSTVQ